MNCPNCAKRCPDAAEDCQSCGLVFAKWRSQGSSAAAPAAPVSIAVKTQEGATSSTLLLFGIFIVTAGLWHWDGISRKQSEAQASANVATAGKLNPLPFRKSIENLEKALYGPIKEGASQAETVQNLAQQVLQDGIDRKVSNLSEHMDVLQQFISQVQESPAPEAQSQWIAGWEQARSKLFKPAPWFKYSPVR